MTQVLHTVRISNVNSIIFVNRIREMVNFELGKDIKKDVFVLLQAWYKEKFCVPMRSEVQYLIGTSNIFFVPCSRQDKKHLSPRSITCKLLLQKTYYSRNKMDYFNLSISQLCLLQEATLKNFFISLLQVNSTNLSILPSSLCLLHLYSTKQISKIWFSIKIQ